MTDYKLVPVEPTPDMLAAGHYAMVAGCHPSGVYADMLAAAPEVQREPVGSKKLYALACLLSGRKGDQYITRVTLHTRFADSEEEAKGSAVSFVLEENPDLAVDQVLCTEVHLPEQKLAPEVVEALEAIVSHHDEYFSDSGTESKMPWIKQARAALAAYRKGGCK